MLEPLNSGLPHKFGTKVGIITSSKRLMITAVKV